jgi:hypothetical protein
VHARQGQVEWTPRRATRYTYVKHHPPRHHTEYFPSFLFQDTQRNRTNFLFRNFRLQSKNQPDSGERSEQAAAKDLLRRRWRAARPRPRFSAPPSTRTTGAYVRQRICFPFSRFRGFPPGRIRRAGALILGAPWNFSLFSVGTKDGFKIFDARTGRLLYENGETCSKTPFASTIYFVQLQISHGRTLELVISTPCLCFR